MADVPSKREKEVMKHEAQREVAIYLVKDRANIAYDFGNYTEALHYFEQLREMDSEPIRTPLLHKYGVCLARERKEKEALAVFSQAIKEGRDSLYDALSALEKALILLRYGKKKELLATLQKALEIDSRIVDSYVTREEYSPLRDLLSEVKSNF